MKSQNSESAPSRKSTQSPYFPDGPQGKCPTCGCKVVLPCHACEIMETCICLGPEEEDQDQLDACEPHLLLSDRKRYEYVKSIRDQHGMTLSEYRTWVAKNGKAPG